MTEAVIDVGSGSVRLLLKGHKKTVMTKLGEGLSATGRLCEEAMERTISVIKSFVDEARRSSERIYLFATEAVRAASNRADFIRRVEKECGIPLEVISGNEEAEIALLGASMTGDATVVDIGGASVEIVSGDGEKMLYVKSLPLGVVRLTEQSGGNPDLVRANAARGIAKYGDVKLRPELIGVGGTLTSLAAMKLGLNEYSPEVVNGSMLEKKDIEKLTGELCALGDERAIKERFPVLPDMRCGLITAGAILADELLGSLGAESIKVSESDNLDGYLRYKQREMFRSDL